VAVKTATGKAFVSWRQLGTESKDITYKLYRNQSLIFTSSGTQPTCYQDIASSDSARYMVSTVIDSIEQDTCNPVGVQQTIYKRFAVRRPDGGVTPGGESFSYTPWDASVGDLDGNGDYEIVFIWQPTNAHDNSESGYTGEVFVDAYTMEGTFMWRIHLGKNIRAGSHYTQLMVYDLDGDGRAEVMMKTADGTYDALSNVIGDPTADYRNGNGYILSGPEYLTIFEGLTGKTLQTIEYKPSRGDVSSWGDNYGNRVDRFLACIAYLDGKRPSVIFCRGYYTRATLVAYDYRDGQLTERWFFDSDSAGCSGAYGQGNHMINVADVDADSCDEIMYGSAGIDHDGTLMYSTGLGHGDSFHTTDINPDRPGYEVYGVHEETTVQYGFELHDACTGEIIWGEQTGYDVGRGISADIDARYRGRECWGDDGIRTCTGTLISSAEPVKNSRIYWDGDLQDELLDKTYVYKWNGSKTTTLFDFSNYSNATYINGTKGVPNISADLFGDWREECVYFDATDSAHLLIFTTVIPTSYRLYTLMHEPIYRLGAAWESVCYNQPPQLGLYIGDGLSGVTQPDIYTIKGTPGTIQTYASIRYLTTSSGAPSQTVTLGTSVKSFNFKCVNATGITVSGLPAGMKYKNTGDTIITIGSKPTEVGIFPYTLTTTGAFEGFSDLSMVAGTITVLNNTDLKKIRDEFSLIVTPNPIRTSAIIRFEASVSGSAHIRIFDLQGRILMRHQIQVIEGMNELTLERNCLSNGLYILEICTNESISRTSLLAE